MKKTIPWALTWLMALILVFSINVKGQDVIAYWDQNSNDLPGGGFGFLADPDVFPQSADMGFGSLTVGGGILSETQTNTNGDLVYTWIPSFGGTTLNAQEGVAGGGSISIQGGTDTGNNGSYIQLEFSTEDYENTSLTYATQSTSSGFNSHAWSWSTDGITFTDILTFTNITTSFANTGVVTVDLPEAANDLETVHLRVTLSGATGSTGNTRLDNITILGDMIVEDFDMVTFYFKGPSWMDNNPHNPEVWGPFTEANWTSGTLAFDSELGWWKADVAVTDATAEITYQMRFSENGTTKYQKAPDGSDPTFTTTTGEIWIDASGDMIWDVGGADDFALAPEYITEEQPLEEPFVTQFQFSAVDENLPTWFGSQLARGLATHGDNLYVPNRNAPAGEQLQIHNRFTGALTGSLNTNGLSGGTFPINDAQTSEDGVVLVSNLAINAPAVFKIYILDAVDAAEVLIELPLDAASRLGDKFSVVGSFDDGSAVIYAADATTPRVFKWTMHEDVEKNGFVFGEAQIIGTTALGATNGSNASVAGLPDGSFYITGGGINIYKLNADGSLIGMVPGGVVATGSSALKYLGKDGNDDILAVFLYGAGNEKLRVLRIPDGDPTAAVIEFDTPSLGAVNSTGNSGVSYQPAADGENADLYVISATNGIASYVTQNFDLEFPVYLPPAEDPVFARAQIIHNSADPAAALVDIFVNGEEFLPNFAFRTATPFVDVPAEVELTIAIAPAGQGIGAAVGTFTVTLTEDETYVIVANGLIPANGDKDDISTDFSLFPYAGAREEAVTATNTDVLVFHGSTDAPTVSVWVMGGDAQLFAFSYGEFQSYLELPTDDYVLEIRTEDGATVVASYVAPLDLLDLDGAAITVLASGFLTAGDDNDNAAFGLFAATAAGGALVELPVYDPPVFTVTFVIEDEEGDAIADAVVTLDGEANAEGDYVFEDLLAGEYAYSIEAAGYQIAEGTVTVVDEDVTVTVTLLVDDIVALTEFFENFDGVTAPALPEGWSKIVEAANTTADIQTSTLSFQVSEPNHIRMLNGNDANPTMLLVGPKITHFETNWLTFWGRNSSATQTADVAIGYMTNPNNAASFVAVDTVSLDGNVYEKFFVDFEGLLDTEEHFLAFKYLPLVNFRTIYMDDVTWEVAPTQPVLTATPEALNFGLTDVDGELSLSLTLQNQGVGTLTITDGDMVFGGADAALFSLPDDLVYPIELELAESFTFDVTFSPVSEGAKTATLTITHNGENSPFDVALTGEGLGILSEFFEDFNGVTPPVLPGGWSAIVESTNENANVETTTLATPFSLPNHVRMQNSGDLGALLMLVSPKVDNFETNWLTFWAKFSTAAQNDNIVIGYTPDRNDAAAFVAVDTIFVSGNVYTRFTYEFPETLLDTDEYHIVFKTDYSSTFRTFVIDDIKWEEQPTAGVLAVSPEAFAWEGIFITETTPNQTFTVSNFGVADLVFEDGSITLTGTDADLFGLIISEDLEFPLTLEPEESFTIEANFSPVEEGAFSANISLVVDGETTLVPLTGTSIDPTLTPAFVFDFLGDFPPENWTRWAGELNDSTELAPVTAVWVHGRFGGQADQPFNSARLNIFGTTRNHWLITPPIDLGDGTTEYMVNFDMALTAWNTSNPGTFGPNQYAAVVISTDNGQTWEPANILEMWGPDDEISNTGEAVTIDLSEYSGIVKIGFYGESRAGGGDVDWFVTNVGVREIEYFTATFNVKDSDNNDILDATVTLDGETLTAAPYLFEDLLFGSYDYSVSKPGYIAVTGSVEIVDEDVVVDVVLLEAFNVDFTVTSGANPVVMANIDIYDASDAQVGALVTDADGEASLLLPAGSYTYDVFAVGFDLLENQAFTIVDADLSIDVVLTGPDPMMLPFAEDFNDTILPEDWIIVNQPNHQPEATWQIIAALAGNSIDGTPFAIINSDAAGAPAGTINSILYTPAIDAADVTGVLTLSFEHFYRHLGANAFGKVEVWNGTEWIELANYTATTGSWAAPALATFDITEHANAQLRVRFHYTDGGSWAWYWAVDNVAVRDLQEYTLTLNVNPEDWGTVTGAGEYLEGSQVEVTATPNAGFAFLNWTDEDGEVVSTEANNVITMPSEDLTLTANFAPGAADPITLNTLLDKIGANLPPEIGSGGNARSAALFQERYVVVASRENGPNVWVWDSNNPHLDPVALDMGTDIIEPITFPINYVRTTETAIYVSNLSLNPSGEGWGQGVFQIYRWTDLEGTPEVVVSYDVLPGRLGDAFSIIGDPEGDGHIVAHINTSKEFRIWNFEGGVLQNEDTPDLLTLDVEFDHINNHGIINPIEGEDDIFVLTSNNIGIMIVNLDGDVLANMGTDVIDMRSYDPNIFYHNGNRYLSYTMNNETNADIAARHQIVDISLGATVIEAINFISTSEILADRIVYDKQMADAGHANLTATNQVAFDEDGELIILAHVVGKGFVLETTGALPATYTLTVEAEPAEGGTVSGGGEYYEGSTVPVAATAAIGYEFVNWTEGTDVVSTDAEFHFTMPASATTLVANFDLIPITDVATLAELRNLPADGTFYRYTGEAVIVAMDGFRNRKFLQDETAAILIFDQPGIITTEYELYDVITDVVGVLNVFNQMVQFQPRFNTEPATENTPVDPYDFTIDGITSADQAKLVKLHNVTFTNVADGQVFANGQNYTITDGENTLTVRTDFWNVDYIGEEIPVTPINLTGVIIQFHDNLQLVPRFEADFEEYIAPETFAVTFNVNMSTAEGFDPDNDVVYMTGNLLGWAEPGTDPANQTMERVGDSWIWTNTLELEAGTYAYKYFINAGWDGGEWAGGDDRSVTVAADMTVNDVWGTMDPVFELTLVVDPANAGTVTGAGLYEEDEQVALTAVAETGFLFVNWTDANDDVVSTTADFTYTMPAMNVVLTANFEVQPSVGDFATLDFNVFPNPARDNFNITANSMIRSIVITDITGKVVYNDIINDTETSINNNFETGIYLVRILTDEGVFVRKLQIQK
ncbi:MAG: DUF4623 domain-containing protein [Bacteroidetes bacterium]|nr:MAG: DUF4623 domain-containing protein [Bacteroidota bacterium]